MRLDQAWCLAASLATSACISGDERRGAADSQPADTRSDIEDGLDRFDSETTRPETLSEVEFAVETTPEVETTAEVEVGPTVCTTPEAPCDDHNACTANGVCDGAVCEPGPAIACDTFSQCHRAGCDPASGCVPLAVDGGMCDGSGAAWGTCTDDRMAPVDRCIGDGSCVDASTSPATPLPRDLIVGNWFFVSASMTNDSSFTRAGSLNFEQGGVVSGSFGSDLGLQIVDASTRVRAWCSDANLGLAFDLGFNHFVGQVDPLGQAMVAYGDVDAEMFVGLRAEGDIIDANGTYMMIHTRPTAPRALQTFAGPVYFDLGCIDEGASLETAGSINPLFVSNDGGCLQTLSGSKHVNLDLELEGADGSTRTWAMNGVIGAGGRVLLFQTRSDSALVPLDGVTLMIRLEDSSAQHFVGTSRWVGALHEYAGLPVARARGARVGLQLADERIETGFIGGVAASGEHIAFDDYGRFLIRLRTEEEQRHWSGYLDSTGGFGFFYEIVDDEGHPVQDIAEKPAWPSFGLIARRLGL